MSDLLLDTCAAIWIADGAAIAPQALEAIDSAARSGTIFLSPMTAWEVGMLVAKRRLTISMAIESWLERVLSKRGVQLAGLTSEVLIASSFLPGTPPNDPTDRIIIATARQNGSRIVTRDRRILDYADQGHVQALAC